MLKRSLIILLLTTLLWSETNTTNPINGTWHLRVMDGKDVRIARAIFDLDMDKMILSGFDACNRMNGQLVKHSEDNISVPMLITTRMACREPIHNWVSLHLHELLKEGFSIKAEEKYGIEGLTIKSPTHELFLKKMGED